MWFSVCQTLRVCFTGLHRLASDAQGLQLYGYAALTSRGSRVCIEMQHVGCSLSRGAAVAASSSLCLLANRHALYCSYSTVQAHIPVPAQVSLTSQRQSTIQQPHCTACTQVICHSVQVWRILASPTQHLTHIPVSPRVKKLMCHRG